MPSIITKILNEFDFYSYKQINQAAKEVKIEFDKSAHDVVLEICEMRKAKTFRERVLLSSSIFDGIARLNEWLGFITLYLPKTSREKRMWKRLYKNQEKEKNGNTI